MLGSVRLEQLKDWALSENIGIILSTQPNFVTLSQIDRTKKLQVA
jgi:hypothetical protein